MSPLIFRNTPTFPIVFPITTPKMPSALPRTSSSSVFQISGRVEVAFTKVLDEPINIRTVYDQQSGLVNAKAEIAQVHTKVLWGHSEDFIFTDLNVQKVGQEAFKVFKALNQQLNLIYREYQAEHLQSAGALNIEVCADLFLVEKRSDGIKRHLLSQYQIESLPIDRAASLATLYAQTEIPRSIRSYMGASKIVRLTCETTQHVMG